MRDCDRRSLRERVEGEKVRGWGGEDGREGAVEVGESAMVREVAGERGGRAGSAGARSASIAGTTPETFFQNVSAAGSATAGSTAGGAAAAGLANELRLDDRAAWRLLARASLRGATTVSAGDVGGETRESTERDDSLRRGVRPKKLANRKCRGSPATEATSDQDCELLLSLILREGWSSTGRAAKYEWWRGGEGGSSGGCLRTRPLIESTIMSPRVREWVSWSFPTFVLKRIRSVRNEGDQVRTEKRGRGSAPVYD